MEPRDVVLYLEAKIVLVLWNLEMLSLFGSKNCISPMEPRNVVLYLEAKIVLVLWKKGVC